MQVFSSSWHEHKTCARWLCGTGHNILTQNPKETVDAAALINTPQRFTITMSTLLTSVVIPITLDCRLTTKLAGSLDEIGTSYPIREKVHK